MAGVFVSYRRADSAAWAGRLSDHLVMRFGGDLVFQDVEDIQPGADWQATIDEEIAGCEAFLAVIGPAWLTLTDATGTARIWANDDVLSNEIATALDQAPTVIPVLVGGAGMPAHDDLPAPVASLASRQAVTLRDDRWAADVGDLIEFLRQVVLPTRDRLSLGDAQRELYRLQTAYFEVLDTSPAEALDLAQRAAQMLDRAMPLYPQDPWLKVTRGYVDKNRSMALSRLGRDDEAGTALAEAERTFVTMLEEDPHDAGAWNGRGSVAALRGEYRRSLEFIDRALEINPDYQEARSDRADVVSRLPTPRDGE